MTPKLTSSPTPHRPCLSPKKSCCYNTRSQPREREFVLQQEQEKVYRTELTPVSFLRRNAYVFPDKVAIVHGDRRYTYRQFEERVNRLSSRLRDAGLQKHDRDRKSTRLNSSHANISYAVFCLKKKQRTPAA